MNRGRAVVLGLLCVSLPTVAAAAPTKKAPAPRLALDARDPDASTDEAIEDVVISAMKTRTTVQEAPAIISVLTADKIAEQGYRRFGEALGSLPGFLPNSWSYGLINTPISRGMLFGTLFLFDGMDMYDPIGFPLITELLPIEAVQRAEVVSGPGGVLWGSNSFVGVVNIVSKTADDIDGVEATIGYGNGVNERNQLRAVVNGGTKLFDGKLKMFGHVSARFGQEQGIPLTARPLLASLEPASNLYQKDYAAGNGQLYALNVIANVQYGPWSLNGWYSTNSVRSSIAQNGVGLDRYLPEDRIDCTNPANKAQCQARVDGGRLNRESVFGLGIDVAILRYRNRFANDRIGIDGRAFIGRFAVYYEPIVATPPSGLVNGGFGVNQNYVSYRVGASLDTDIALPAKFRILAGGELFYDWLPINRAIYQAEPASFDLVPFQCPEPIGNNPCPSVAHNSSNRLTGGMFLSLQKRLLPTVALSGGARVQLYAGKRQLDPVALFEGAAVWTFVPNWNLKLNFTEGFRPPSLLKTDNGTAISWDGNPNLKVERSRAVQGEINGRLLEDVGGIRSLTIRADYAYTWVNDFIVIRDGRFQNTARIGIHTLELLARLALKRGHTISVGYTFNDANSDDEGKLRSIPAQWLTLQTAFNLWRRRVWFTSNLTILGAFEDPNQYPRSDGGTLALGQVDAAGNQVPQQVWRAEWTDRVLDRVGPSIQWNAGVRWLIASWKTELRMDVYNILNAKAYNTEGFMDLSATFEGTPSPWRGTSFLARATVAL